MPPFDGWSSRHENFMVNRPPKGKQAEAYMATMTVGHFPQPRREVSDEPEELRIWRAIAAYRDALVRRASNDGVDGAIALFSDTARRLGADTSQLDTFKEEVRESFAADAAVARQAILELDAQIAKRPPRSPPPSRLLDQLRRPKLAAAMAKVEEWLKNQENVILEWQAWAALRTVAADPEALGDGSVQKLADRARGELAETGSYKSHQKVARWMVGIVSGVGPAARILR